MKTIPLTENEINHIKETYSQELERLQKRVREITSILRKLGGLSDEMNEPDNIKVYEEELIKEEEETSIPSNHKFSGKPVSASSETNLELIENNSDKPTARRGRPVKIKPEDIAINNDETPITAPKKKTGRKKLVKEKIRNIEGDKPLESIRSRWTIAILDVLQEQENVLSSNSIVKKIMKKQNIIASDYNRTSTFVAGSLTNLKKVNRLKTIKKPGVKGNFYGLAEWFDESGALIDETKLNA